MLTLPLPLLQEVMRLFDHKDEAAAGEGQGNQRRRLLEVQGLGGY